MLNRLHEKFKDHGAQFFSIHSSRWGQIGATGDPTSIEHLITFRDTYGLRFPLLWDKGEKFGRDYDVETYPTIYIVDKGGGIAAGYAFIDISGTYNNRPTEFPTEERLTQELDRLLNSGN